MKRKLTFAEEKKLAEELARKEREERELESYGQWRRELGLGLAENFGGLFGMRFSRKTEREMLGLPPEEKKLQKDEDVEEITAEKTSTSKKADAESSAARNRVQGDVVTSDRPIGDTGRRQINPDDFDLTELAVRLTPLVTERMSLELRRKSTFRR